MLAETSVASAGVGYQDMQYYDNLPAADMYAMLLLVFLAAMALNGLIGRLIRHVTRYQQPAPEGSSLHDGCGQRGHAPGP